MKPGLLSSRSQRCVKALTLITLAMRPKHVFQSALMVILAATVLGSCHRAKRVSELIDDLQHGDRLQVRAQAANELGDRKAREAVQPLIDCLDGPEAVRTSAARALGSIQDPRAVEPLIGLLKDMNPLLRSASARALGRIGDSRAVLPLVDALKAGNEEAAPALVEFGKAAIPPLIECL